MTIPRQIFKTYDIRGLVDKDITPEFAYHLGRAFATFIRRELGGQVPTVAVGYDMRPSSIPYEAELVKGLVAQGARVIRMGLLSTPGFYFGVSHVAADGGIQISASHNPATYNGFKLVRARAVAISGETGIQTIADIMEKDQFDPDSNDGEVETVAGIADKQVEAEIDFAQVKELPKLKLVADSANGMGAQYLDVVFKNYNFDVTRLFWEFDGMFPNHEADPFKAVNNQAICAKVKELGADIGIHTDGDGDRIFFIDDKGEVVEPAIIRGLVARVLLPRFPGATIGYDIRPGKITEDMIREGGGVPLVTRVGHALIKEVMIKSGAVFAGELTGHFYMRMPSGVYEAPVATMLIILAEIANTGKKLSKIASELRRYSYSGEFNFHLVDPIASLARIREHFADGEQSDFDGLSVTYPDYWFNVRLSNTESLLRLNLEAVDHKTMQEKLDEVAGVIKER